MAFKFEIDAAVMVKAKPGIGRVIGRSEFRDRKNSYLVDYVAEENQAISVQNWWDEDALDIAPTPPA